MANLHEVIIPYYSPISAKGGSKARRIRRNKKLRTKRHNRSNKSRTRRIYH